SGGTGTDLRRRIQGDMPRAHGRGRADGRLRRRHKARSCSRAASPGAGAPAVGVRPPERADPRDRRHRGAYRRSLERGEVILLDSHVVVRYLEGDRKKLGRRTVAAIDKTLSDSEVFVSAISFWEIAMLVAKDRLELDMTVPAFRVLALRHG